MRRFWLSNRSFNPAVACLCAAILALLTARAAAITLPQNILACSDQLAVPRGPFYPLDGNVSLDGLHRGHFFSPKGSDIYAHGVAATQIVRSAKYTVVVWDHEKLGVLTAHTFVYAGQWVEFEQPVRLRQGKRYIVSIWGHGSDGDSFFNVTGEASLSPHIDYLGAVVCSACTLGDLSKAAPRNELYFHAFVNLCFAPAFGQHRSSDISQLGWIQLASRSWKEYPAQEDCLLLGGNLVSILSEEENEAVRDFVLALDDFAYIGINDTNAEGNLTWVDPRLAGFPLTYINWESLVFHETGEACAYIMTNGKWRNLGCSGNGIFAAEFFSICFVPYVDNTLAIDQTYIASSVIEELSGVTSWRACQNRCITAPEETCEKWRWFIDDERCHLEDAVALSGGASPTEMSDYDITCQGRFCDDMRDCAILDDDWNYTHPLDCCSSAYPCMEGIGYCASNDECAGRLVCGSANCREFSDVYEDGNCCAVCDDPSNPFFAPSESCCTADMPCGEGQGGCTSDDHCIDGLHCGLYGTCDQYHERYLRSKAPLRCCTACSASRPCSEGGRCHLTTDCSEGLVCEVDGCEDTIFGEGVYSCCAPGPAGFDIERVVELDTRERVHVFTSSNPATIYALTLEECADRCAADIECNYAYHTYIILYKNSTCGLYILAIGSQLNAEDRSIDYNFLTKLTPAPTIGTIVPYPQATPTATSLPSLMPTSIVTSVPTTDPMSLPTPSPTSVSTLQPSLNPTSLPTLMPTPIVTSESTANPAFLPSASSTPLPSAEPDALVHTNMELTNSRAPSATRGAAVALFKDSPAEMYSLIGAAGVVLLSIVIYCAIRRKVLRSVRSLAVVSPKRKLSALSSPECVSAPAAQDSIHDANLESSEDSSESDEDSSSNGADGQTGDRRPPRARAIASPAQHRVAVLGDRWYSDTSVEERASDAYDTEEEIGAYDHYSAELFDKSAPLSIEGEFSQTVRSGELFSCDKCGEQIGGVPKMKLHMKVVHGEEDARVFKCDVCHQSFDRKWLLKTHQRIHFKDKPFQCSLCNKGFKQRSNLRRHVKIVHETPFKCRKCPLRFESQDAAAQHLMDAHGLQPRQRERIRKSVRESSRSVKKRIALGTKQAPMLLGNTAPMQKRHDQLPLSVQHGISSGSSLIDIGESLNGSTMDSSLNVLSTFTTAKQIPKVAAAMVPDNTVPLQKQRNQFQLNVRVQPEISSRSPLIGIGSGLDGSTMDSSFSALSTLATATQTPSVVARAPGACAYVDEESPRPIIEETVAPHPEGIEKPRNTVAYVDAQSSKFSLPMPPFDIGGYGQIELVDVPAAVFVPQSRVNHRSEPSELSEMSHSRMYDTDGDITDLPHACTGPYSLSTGKHDVGSHSISNETKLDAYEPPSTLLRRLSNSSSHNRESNLQQQEFEFPRIGSLPRSSLDDPFDKDLSDQEPSSLSGHRRRSSLKSHRSTSLSSLSMYCV